MSEINNINQTSFKSYYVPNFKSNVTNPIENQSINTNSDFYIDTKGAEAIKLNSNISLPTDITKAISVDEYLSKLKNAGMVKGKDFEVFAQPNGGKSIYIQDKNGEATKIVFWYNGSNAENFDGYQNITIQKNQSRVITEYDRNNILNSKSIWYENAKEHRNLFPEDIDTNTKPQDYIAKLKEKNINYEMKKFEENGEKSTFIVEKDNNETPIKMTSFLEYPDGGRFINQSNSPDKFGNFGHEINMVSDGNYCDITVTDHVKRLGIKG